MDCLLLAQLGLAGLPSVLRAYPGSGNNCNNTLQVARMEVWAAPLGFEVLVMG
jgi:hypothetical protein